MAPLAKKSETTKLNERNQEMYVEGYSNSTETLTGQYTLSYCNECSWATSTRYHTWSSEVEAKGDINQDDRISSGIEQSCDVSADSDSESEPEREVHTIRRRRKLFFPPTHREEFHAPFIWQFTDNEPLHEPGHHLIANGRNECALPLQKSSHLSSAQYKSQKRRDAITDTSSEDRHWSIDVDIKPALPLQRDATTDAS